MHDDMMKCEHCHEVRFCHDFNEVGMICEECMVIDEVQEAIAEMFADMFDAFGWEV